MPNNIYQNQTKHNAFGRVDLFAKVALGASGAVTSGSEKGLFWTVTKTDTGQYTFVIDEVWVDTLKLEASITGAVGTTASCGEPTIGASSTTVVVTTCTAGTPADIANQQLRLAIVAQQNPGPR